jgi:hypothetical protein
MPFPNGKGDQGPRCRALMKAQWYLDVYVNVKAVYSESLLLKTITPSFAQGQWQKSPLRSW